MARELDRDCGRVSRTERQTIESPFENILEVAMADTAKCAHPACSCMVSKGGEHGKYCSEHCKEAKGVTVLRCDCRHPGCS